MSDLKWCGICGNCERIDMQDGKIGAKCTVRGRVTDVVTKRYAQLVGRFCPEWCKDFREVGKV